MIRAVRGIRPHFARMASTHPPAQRVSDVPKSDIFLREAGSFTAKIIPGLPTISASLTAKFNEVGSDFTEAEQLIIGDVRRAVEAACTVDEALLEAQRTQLHKCHFFIGAVRAFAEPTYGSRFWDLSASLIVYSQRVLFATRSEEYKKSDVAIEDVWVLAEAPLSYGEINALFRQMQAKMELGAVAEYKELVRLQVAKRSELQLLLSEIPQKSEKGYMERNELNDVSARLYSINDQLIELEAQKKAKFEAAIAAWRDDEPAEQI